MRVRRARPLPDPCLVPARTGTTERPASPSQRDALGAESYAPRVREGITSASRISDPVIRSWPATVSRSGACTGTARRAGLLRISRDQGQRVRAGFHLVGLKRREYEPLYQGGRLNRGNRRYPVGPGPRSCWLTSVGFLVSGGGHDRGDRPCGGRRRAATMSGRGSASGFVSSAHAELEGRIPGGGIAERQLPPDRAGPGRAARSATRTAGVPRYRTAGQGRRSDRFACQLRQPGAAARCAVIVPGRGNGESAYSRFTYIHHRYITLT
jgi:hypothetical protein